MRSILVGSLVLSVALASLASCGRRDNSGIFVATEARRVTLIQLVETADHHLTGRFEEVSVGPDGTVDSVVTAIDGAASKDELTVMLKPVNFLDAGITMSGKVSGDTLTLVSRGTSVQARRSSIERYQSAIQVLQTSAAAKRKMADAANAEERARASAARSEAALADRQKALIDTNSRLDAGAADLVRQTTALNAALDEVPDFGLHAKSNTARIAQMLRTASTLSPDEKNDRMIEMNQIVIDTNQLEIERNQHRIELNQVVEPAAALSGRMETFCRSSEARDSGDSCAKVKTATAAFQVSLTRGRTLFSGMAQIIRDELRHQVRMIGGREQN